MKLNKTFIQQKVCDSHVAVSPEYNGMLCLNESANLIMEMLQKETTEAELLDALCDQYDAPRAEIKDDLDKLLAQLREKGLLDD